MPSSLFRRKNIDQLISDCEGAEFRLKKSLGWLSLTSLGIGAVIGSGIFTIVGTAIAGQKFQTSSILNAPLLQYLVHHNASFGRPGAGPAIALSFILVAIACGFASVCYAELAAMIPIAGSAYTYTYATMGELIAWIIGWDLILEYAVSNMAVSVGFSAHLVDLLDWFGLHPDPKWISPAYLPSGLSDLQGNMIYGPGWHFGFNWPAFIIVMLLTVILVRGIRESASTNNLMVMVKIIAILAFVTFASRFIHTSNWHPFAPNGWPGILTGGSIVFFTYIGFDSVSTAAEECKNPQRDLPRGIIATLIVCTLLYIGVVVVLTGLVKWDTLLDDAAPVVNTLKKLHISNLRLIVLIGALMGMISSLLVFQIGQARVWFAMSRDGLFPKDFQPRPPQISHARFLHLGRGLRSRHSSGPARHRHLRRPLQHRNALRVRVGCRRRSHPSLPRTRAQARLPRAWWSACPDSHHRYVLAPDGRSAYHELDPIFWLACNRTCDLFSVQPEAQYAEPASGQIERGYRVVLRAIRIPNLKLVFTLGCALALVSLLAPPQARAWGDNANKLVVNRAIETLPPDLRSFFENSRGFLLLHVNDPLAVCTKNAHRAPHAISHSRKIRPLPV